MTHSERDVQVVLSEHPEVAERLIDEMDRAGRDYLRLREVERERDALLETNADLLADKAVWKRKAKAAEAEFSATFADRNELLAHYQRVTAEKLALEAQITLLQGAIAAQDERERIAGERCGVPYEMHACDWPEWVADEVLTLRADRDEWKRKAEAAEARVEDMEREATEDATEQDRLLAYARKMRGRRDVHNVYEVFDWMQAQLAVTKTQLNEAVAETQVLEYQRDQIASTFAQLAAAREDTCANCGCGKSLHTTCSLDCPGKATTHAAREKGGAA